MKWFIISLLYCVLAQNLGGKFEEDLKGTLIKYIFDLPNSPSKTIYSLQTENGVVELVVNDPKFIVVQPGEVVRAPVTKLREGVYQLNNFVRPLYQSDYMAVGSGGIDGSGLNLMRLKTDEFIHRVHNDVPNGIRKREMETQATTERSLLIVLLNFRSKSLPPSTTSSRVSSWMFDGPDSVDKLYNDCTRGQFRFPKQKSVMAPRIYTVNDPNDAQSTSPWLAEVASMATQAVRQDGLNPANYDHFVMILPSFSSSDNGASGLAPVGPGCGKPCNVFINIDTINDDGWATEAIAHELGHNLGWLHSGVPADGGFNVPRPRSSIESEYGDLSGVMGNGQPICPVLINQLAYKWITATEMISSSKLAQLSPMGSPSPNTLQGLIVLTQPTVYVSYRATVGPDDRFKKVDQMGRGQWANAVYVHIKKQEIGTTAIAKISVGQTFNQGSYSISFVSQNGNVAQVCVSINGAPCSNSGGGSGGGSGGSGPIRPCDNNPCGPNGECIPQVNSYVCQCKPGFVGTKCESGVCGSITISGFTGNVAVLNGQWKRINDYAGKVAYSSNNMYFYFVPPSMWVIGPNLGGSSYYAIAQTNVDSPQTITTWMYNQVTQIVCGGGGGGAPAGTDCVGQWSEWSQCSAQCNGFQSRTYKVIKPATGNGAICTSQDGQREQRGCGPTCQGAPVNCAGNFYAVGQCGINCLQTAEYRISQPASNGGAPCSYQQGATIQYKCSGGQCNAGPINCVGSFVGQSQCMQNCEFTAVYRITQQAANGGAQCPNRDGDVGRWKCTGGLCQSGAVNCVGSWVGQSQCMQNCEFTARFTIVQPPSNGGAPCNFREGDIGRWRCTGGYCQSALLSGDASTTQKHNLNPSIVVIASACVVSAGIVFASLIWKRQRQAKTQMEYVLM